MREASEGRAFTSSPVRVGLLILYAIDAVGRLLDGPAHALERLRAYKTRILFDLLERCRHVVQGRGNFIDAVQLHGYLHSLSRLRVGALRRRAPRPPRRRMSCRVAHVASGRQKCTAPYALPSPSPWREWRGSAARHSMEN